MDRFGVCFRIRQTEANLNRIIFRFFSYSFAKQKPSLVLCCLMDSEISPQTKKQSYCGLVIIPSWGGVREQKSKVCYWWRLQWKETQKWRGYRQPQTKHILWTFYLIHILGCILGVPCCLIHMFSWPFSSSTEIDDMLRKSTNLLLTRTLNSGLQNLIKKPHIGLTEVSTCRNISKLAE